MPTAQVIVAHGLDAEANDQASAGADRRCDRNQSGQEAAAIVGRRRLLLRRQYRGAGATRDRRLMSPPGRGRSIARPKERAAASANARRGHARENQGGRSRQPLPLAQASCPSRCSGRSSRRAASVSSCCAASRRCKGEWGFVCLAHNLLKLANRRDSAHRRRCPDVSPAKPPRPTRLSLNATLPPSTPPHRDKADTLLVDHVIKVIPPPVPLQIVHLVAANHSRGAAFGRQSARATRRPTH